MERIGSPEDLEKARQGGRVVVCGSDHNAVLHTPSCGRLDAMIPDGGAEALRLFKNLAAARKSNPAIKTCGECDPEAAEIRDALNRSGPFSTKGYAESWTRWALPHIPKCR